MNLAHGSLHSHTRDTINQGRKESPTEQEGVERSHVS